MQVGTVEVYDIVVGEFRPIMLEGVCGSFGIFTEFHGHGSQMNLIGLPGGEVAGVVFEIVNIRVVARPGELGKCLCPEILLRVLVWLALVSAEVAMLVPELFPCLHVGCNQDELEHSLVDIEVVGAGHAESQFLVPREVGDDDAASKGRDTEFLVLIVVGGVSRTDILEELHISHGVAGTFYADITELDVKVGVYLAETAEEFSLELDESVGPCGVGTAALEYGTETCLGERDVTFPESEVESKSDIALDHGIDLPLGIVAVLAHLVAVALVAVGLPQCGIEPEVGLSVHIECHIYLQVGCSGNAES